jgi:XTP/dITP diphosphohydrolase
VSGVTYLLATRSAGKLRELRPLFEQCRLKVVDLREADVAEQLEEDEIELFDTFEANARAKGEYFFWRSGLPTFADDSGLSVHSLGGRPGVRSKRWSGRTDLEGELLDAANNAKLLAELATLPASSSFEAEYVCAAAFTDERGTIVRLGRTAGRVIRPPRGTHGFGYDPYFLSSELGKTFGEADTAEKNLVSHRGRAFSALLSILPSLA